MWALNSVRFKVMQYTKNSKGALELELTIARRLYGLPFVPTS